jgi:hypothetical protein
MAKMFSTSKKFCDRIKIFLNLQLIFRKHPYNFVSKAKGATFELQPLGSVKYYYFSGDYIIKRLVISASILLILVLTLVQSFAATQNKKDRGSEHNATQARKSQADSNSVTTEMNSQVDPNVQRIKEEFEELKETLERINENSQDEIRQWMSRRIENRIALAKEVHEQVLKELNFIKKIAAEEEATKTIMTINKILDDRQKRFEKMLKEMEQEQEKLRRRKQREHKDRDNDSSTNRRRR